MVICVRLANSQHHPERKHIQNVISIEALPTWHRLVAGHVLRPTTLLKAHPLCTRPNIDKLALPCSSNILKYDPEMTQDLYYKKSIKWHVINLLVFHCGHHACTTR